MLFAFSLDMRQTIATAPLNLVSPENSKVGELFRGDDRLQSRLSVRLELAMFELRLTAEACSPEFGLTEGSFAGFRCFGIQAAHITAQSRLNGSYWFKLFDAKLWTTEVTLKHSLLANFLAFQHTVIFDEDHCSRRNL